MLFNFILVLYNYECKKNDLVKSLLTEYKYPASLFVFDNSTEDEIILKNQSFCKLNQINYYGDGLNYGLSYAYNYVIKLINKEINNWVIILDQDTHFNISFLDYYIQSIASNNNKMIYTPIIKDSIGIMSPSIEKKNTMKHIEDYKTELLCKCSFINSCMCINSIVFLNLKYDENLFLDCIDHDFIKSFKLNYSVDKIYVIENLVIHQEFSGVTRNTVLSDLKRYGIFVKDYRIYTKKWKLSNFQAEIKLFYRALKLSLIHHTPKFILIYFKWGKR
ncbi:MAG: hypothetical protein MJ185_02125 [Treponema sp.]|nr:hypothetical protein [Treponema sp.]